jgi:hypothetical protein
MAAPGDEIEPQPTLIPSGGESLGAPTGPPQTPQTHRLRRSATDSQRDYLLKAASDKQSLLNDELSQSLNTTSPSRWTGQPINEAAKRRAIDANLSQGEICLISNARVWSLQLCHVVNRATPTSVVSGFLQRASNEADYHPTLSRLKV